MKWFAQIVLVVFLTACGKDPEHPPIPAAIVEAARLPGFEEIRHWGDAGEPSSAESSVKLPARCGESSFAQTGPPLNVLIISGGGANGSFSAGFLTGLSAAGARPQFHVVTGVSVGALMAPFAFLGPQYDEVIANLFPRLSGREIIAPRPRLIAYLSDALASSEPLEKLIAEFVDEPLMFAIAAEHRKGRRLFVSTTHIYAGRQVIWDIGAIAVSARPDATALVRRVLLASASVPILLPPVFFEVEARGGRYSEMHVDGGITRQAFAAPPGFDWSSTARALGLGGQINFYVIRNGRVISEYMVMQPEVIGLGEHAMHQLTQSLGIGDLNTIYVRAQRECAAFHAAWIGEDFIAPWSEWYDRRYAQALFDYGHGLAIKGNMWRALPPGLK